MIPAADAFACALFAVALVGGVLLAWWLAGKFDDYLARRFDNEDVG